VRSARQLMDRSEFNLRPRWFRGLGVDDLAWSHSVFSKNRDRLLNGLIAAKLMQTILIQPKVK
jgi:transposase